jgi:hypothetical protein
MVAKVDTLGYWQSQSAMTQITKDKNWWDDVQQERRGEDTMARVGLMEKKKQHTSLWEFRENTNQNVLKNQDWI